jgi:ABC-type proline/glycine betaine transport system permease subunit
MTIEIALSGLTYSMFCALLSLLIVGISLILSIAMIYVFIKALVFLLKATKGGVDNLKESVKELSHTIST